MRRRAKWKRYDEANRILPYWTCGEKITSEVNCLAGSYDEAMKKVHMII
jgi:hypothetical protein